MKKLLSIFLIFAFCLSFYIPVNANKIKEPNLELEAKSAVLMDAKTGTVLFSQNKDVLLPPASVTKIMTLLLIFEAIETGNLKYNDVLTVSEHAASMGGSQVYLEQGEKMSVDELLKCVIVASANDAALTLAEHVGGSEKEFVSMMNEKAASLGMNNTHFENVTGLDDNVINHLTTAYDIALMSKELIKHEKICEYATIWTDTIRNGEFGLTNTNRLVRYYRGITGLKTGSTSKAGFCISATAKRDGLELIAVIMGSESAEIRNSCATKLLDYGFSHYSIYEDSANNYSNIKVLKGTTDEISTKYNECYILIEKGKKELILKKYELLEYLEAPIKKGDIVGKITYSLNGEVIAENKIYSLEDVDKISFWNYFFEVIRSFIICI